MSRCQTRTGSVAGTVDGAQRRPGLVDPGVGERRDEPRHRVGQLERALLVEHHRRDRGDRLGHRVDAPERVVGHRQPGLEVAQPVVGQVRDAPAPGDRDRPARRAGRRRRSGGSAGRSARAARRRTRPPRGSASTLIRATGRPYPRASWPRRRRRGRGRRGGERRPPHAGGTRPRVTSTITSVQSRASASPTSGGCSATAGPRGTDPASTVSPVTPSTHQPRSSRAGQRGGVDDDRRRAGMAGPAAAARPRRGRRGSPRRPGPRAAARPRAHRV